MWTQIRSTPIHVITGLHEMWQFEALQYMQSVELIVSTSFGDFDGNISFRTIIDGLKWTKIFKFNAIIIYDCQHSTYHAMCADPE